MPAAMRVRHGVVSGAPSYRTRKTRSPLLVLPTPPLLSLASNLPINIRKRKQYNRSCIRLPVRLFQARASIKAAIERQDPGPNYGTRRDMALHLIVTALPGRLPVGGQSQIPRVPEPPAPAAAQMGQRHEGNAREPPAPRCGAAAQSALREARPKAEPGVWVGKLSPNERPDNECPENENSRNKIRPHHPAPTNKIQGYGRSALLTAGTDTAAIAARS
jgi:hypothetical protein